MSRTQGGGQSLRRGGKTGNPRGGFLERRRRMTKNVSNATMAPGRNNRMKNPAEGILEIATTVVRDSFLRRLFGQAPLLQEPGIVERFIAYFGVLAGCAAVAGIEVELQ